MHGQGNYTIQVGQDPYVRAPAFQQHPAASTTPATSHYGPPAPQPQVIQQGHASFQPTPGIAAYQHALPGVPPKGPRAPVLGGQSSAQSFLPHPRAPHISTQISHSYATSEQQPLPWNQNVHQLPPAAPLPGPSAYQPPSSQGETLKRGPLHQPPSHAPSPPLPPYSSSSGALMSDPFGSSVVPMPGHSHRQPMVPAPPPPPPPSSSPPRVPPLPPSSPPSDIISKRDGGHNLKGSLDGNNLMMECRSVGETDVPFQHTEKSGLKVGSLEAVVAHSPADSDMDMEDDITHPDVEKENCLPTNSNDEYVSISQEGYTKEQLQHLQHAGGHRLPEIAPHGNLVFAEAPVSRAQRGGSEVTSDYNFPVTMKGTSEADDPGMSENGKTKHPLDVSVEESSSQHKDLGQLSLPIFHSETGYGKLSDQAMEGANPFKLLQGYASDNTSENEEDNRRNVGSHSGAERRSDFGPELRHENLSESNKHMLSKSRVESPKNVMQSDKLSLATGIVEGISDRSHRSQEPDSIHTVAHQPKDSRNYGGSIGLEGANLHIPDMKSSSNKLNVDEFGRIVREGVSDSDTSDSPHYTRKHARRTRKRSRSRSRSRSTHDRRRRRRSPWKRKERRSQSRSLSPKRRRSRSRSPFLRRDSEFGGDKLRREKGHLPECFDFLRGKCYRGATCRYSHHESDKSDRSRYNRGKQHQWDMPPSSRSPDFHERKVHPDKEIKDKGLRLPQDMPGPREAKHAKRLPVDSTTDSPSKLGSLESGSLLVTDVVASNRSGYSANGIPSGIGKSLVPESAVQYSDEIPQTVDQQGKRIDDILVSESSIPALALVATSTHHPADKSVGFPTTKPYSTEEVPAVSLKELLPSIANHSFQLTLPLPSSSQAVSAPFVQPIAQDYNSKPPLSWNHLTPENYPPYQAPVAYQHAHLPGPLKSLSSSFPPLRPPPPPTGEHNISSQHMQQSLLPPWDGLSSYTSVRAQPTELPYQSQTGQYQAYPLAREADQMLDSTDSFGSSSLHVSNLTSRRGGPHMMGEDRRTGHPVQSMNPSHVQSQPNSLLTQSPLKGTHGSVGGGLPSDCNSLSHPYFQQASYGLQYSGPGDVGPAQHAEPGTVGSSASRITPDFLERNHPSYVRDFVESRTSNYFNPYASTFDLPPSSKFSSSVLIQENDTTINTKYGASVGLSTAPVDAHKIGSLGSKNISDLSRQGGDQYDPLFDSIEPASNSLSKADHQKHETTGDSDDVLKISGSGRLLNMEGIKQEGETAASANDSMENEECGETADIAVGAVLNGTPSSNPNDATDVNAGEIEIDQVKTSGKKKKSKERSMKLFKVSIATFVKEVLKPSWRQGNMSKEAFKTIVKKTVDKVSGAMKSHQIPKSQAKINHYIDSSRGKLTKLVMGYVDKYVKV